MSRRGCGKGPAGKESERTVNLRKVSEPGRRASIREILTRVIFILEFSIQGSGQGVSIIAVVVTLSKG